MATATKVFLTLLLVLLAGPGLAALTGAARLDGNWRTASREPLGKAPDPAQLQEAVIQVYGARAFKWRGAFAVHTWIAAKRTGAKDYTIYEVIGWRQWHGGNPVVVRHDRHPDRRWYGAAPEVYLDRRGRGVDILIDRVEKAVARYPYADQYRTWPGPNSNTFTAFIGRSVPELRMDLPPTAVGKDFLGDTTFAAASPSGTGYQFSIFGLVGVLAAVEEGIEVSLLGLSFGIDPLDLAIKVPGFGRLSATDR